MWDQGDLCVVDPRLIGDRSSRRPKGHEGILYLRPYWYSGDRGEDWSTSFRLLFYLWCGGA